jgi:hypothetical protein
MVWVNQFSRPLVLMLSVMLPTVVLAQSDNPFADTFTVAQAATREPTSPAPAAASAPAATRPPAAPPQLVQSAPNPPEKLVLICNSPSIRCFDRTMKEKQCNEAATSSITASIDDKFVILEHYPVEFTQVWGHITELNDENISFHGNFHVGNSSNAVAETSGSIDRRSGILRFFFSIAGTDDNQSVSAQCKARAREKLF